MMRKWLLSSIISWCSFFLIAQQQSDSTFVKRKVQKAIFGGIAGAYTIGSLSYLDVIWYKPYNSGAFHIYDDNAEWLQMDKIGHSFTTYNTGRLFMRAALWSGFNRNKSILIGELYGTLYMTSIEIMDGFSSGWGFSWGDELANVSGSLLFGLQEYFWKDERIQMKFSFHPTRYAKYRPEELGTGISQIIKDYNGQTYWLSTNISSFLRKESKFPKWLNIAFGYGAEDMISGKDNYFINAPYGELIGKNRYRKLFLSLDVDFTKIKTRSKFLKSVFSIFNSFKIPFPAFEFSKGRIKGYPLYF